MAQLLQVLYQQFFHHILENIQGKPENHPAFIVYIGQYF